MMGVDIGLCMAGFVITRLSKVQVHTRPTGTHQRGETEP
jgi:hypothetical protein